MNRTSVQPLQFGGLFLYPFSKTVDTEETSGQEKTEQHFELLVFVWFKHDSNGENHGKARKKQGSVGVNFRNHVRVF